MAYVLGENHCENVTSPPSRKHSPIRPSHVLYSPLLTRAVAKLSAEEFDASFPIKFNMLCDTQPPSSESVSSPPAYNLKSTLIRDSIKCLL
jgi:hypothetical protein